MLKLLMPIVLLLLFGLSRAQPKDFLLLGTASTSTVHLRDVIRCPEGSFITALSGLASLNLLAVSAKCSSGDFLPAVGPSQPAAMVFNFKACDSGFDAVRGTSGAVVVV